MSDATLDRARVLVADWMHDTAELYFIHPHTRDDRESLIAAIAKALDEAGATAAAKAR